MGYCLSRLHSNDHSVRSYTAHAGSARQCNAVAHQSMIVEEVINRHTSQVTEAISNDLDCFTNKFIELGFIRRAACYNIRTKHGIGNVEKGSQLLNLVIANCRSSHYKKEWFDKFIGVFSSEAAHRDLAASMTRDLTTSMTMDFERCVSISPSSPSTSDTAHPSVDASISPVKSFVDYVKTFYRSKNVERDTSVVKWPPTPSEVYINLACIDRQSVSVKSKEYAEVTEAMVRDGNVDVILNVTKGPIDFSEIAKNISIPNSGERVTFLSDEERLILVEGAPGVGKSTFAWEFCRRWERGEIAQQYQLVLLLRLREKRISNAKRLEDLIYHPLERVPQAVCHELVRSHDLHTLIILEGFDELPDVCRNAGSVFMDLIAGKLLPLATVLVTSRPWATEQIRLNHKNRICQHIEVLGFTGHQITEYIESTLPQDKLSDLTAYLESHPQIKAGMYIPLNSAIVVTVYDESQASGHAMPATLTDLYTCLAQTLLVRYLRGHPEYETDGRFPQTFNDLPPAVHTKFYHLCKLAYSGTVGSSGQVQLIFRNLPAGFDDLGFMDSVTELYVTQGAVSSHNFLHLTFQEFFSAIHISTMQPAQHVKHFKRHKEDRLKIVLRFLAGLNKLHCFSGEVANYFFQTPSRNNDSRFLMSCDVAVGIDIVQWLFEAQRHDAFGHVLGQKKIEVDLLSTDMLLLDYYSLGYCISHSQCQWVLKLGEEVLDVAEVRMIAAGASASRDPNGKLVDLRREWECQRTYAKVMCSMYENMNLQIRETKAAFSLSVGYLHMLFNEWKNILLLHRLSLKLTVPCDLISWPDLSALRVLVLEIQRKNVEMEWKLETLLTCVSLDSLAISPASSDDDCLLYEDCVAIGDHVASTTSLQDLCILSNIFDEKGVEVITSALTNNHSLPLKRLELECECTFTVTAANNLAQFITNNTTLQNLSIKTKRYLHRIEAITAALASNHSLPLKQLSLECECTFIATAGDSLAQFITHSSTLQFLSILKCTFSAHALLALVRAHNPVLQSKIIEDFYFTVSADNEAQDLAQLLVKYPDIGYWRYCTHITGISDAGAEALAQALHHNGALRKLNLSNNIISDGGAVALAHALHHNSTLTELDISNNCIGGGGAEALAQALHNNSTLLLLNLSKNDISDTGAVALAQALHHNCALTELYLSNKNISDAGAVFLARALNYNCALTELYLSNNNISDDGAIAIAQALHHNSTVVVLNLSNNYSISDAGAVFLARALHYNSTLVYLNLSGNDKGGTSELVQALTVSKSMYKTGGLSLPRRCMEYATQCPQYHTVKSRIKHC